MAVFTARNAKVDISATYAGSYTNLGNMLKWTLKTETEGKDYCSSSTSGRRKRAAGNSDISGSIEIQADDATACPITDGSSIAVRLYENATKYHQAEIYVESVEPEADVDSADIVGYKLTFSGNGLYAPPA